MRKILSITLAGMIMSCAGRVVAQSTVETALLFSRIKPGGSARIQAMGGAQVSLGGDYSSAFSNPAGLGMYNRSEFTFSPAVTLYNTSSDYIGTSTDATKSTFILPGLSIVFNSQKNKKGFLAGTFGVSFNRTNDFNRTFEYEATNASNSIIDYFLQDADGFEPSSFENGGDNYNSPTGLAYNNYLIEDSTFFYPNASNKGYLSVMGTYPDNPQDIRRQLQHEEVKASGAQNQWSFSYGANISDKFFVGAGVGIATLRYAAKKTYTESNFVFDLDPSFLPLDNMVLSEDLKITGSGFNANVGIIARPADFIQLGASYSTPTAYQLTDTYSANMATLWNNFDYFQDGSPKLKDVSAETEVLQSEYKLKTPGRMNFGATLFAQKHGFVSADVELVNYGAAKYSGELSYDNENANIKTLYNSVVNYRAGGEYRLNKFRFRGGYSFMTDPFKTPQNGTDRKISTFSGGIGYRSARYFVDLAFTYSQGNVSYRPYRVNSAESPLVKIGNQNMLVMATIGFPF